MTNRTFLYIWFPLSWVITASVSLVIVRVLGSSVLALGERMGDQMKRFLRVAFPAGIVLPAFSALLSVCYFEHGCGGFANSQSVISTPGWLQQTAQLQMAAICEFLPYVLLAWAIIYAVLLIAWKQTQPSA
jgi:hypothetical protein